MDLRTSGAVNLLVVDNLLVVNDCDSKISMLFDIKSGDTDYPIAGALPIAPYLADPSVELYNENWIFVRPNYIIDPEAGYVWEVTADLTKLSLNFSDRIELVEFLVRRSVKGSKIILSQIKAIIEEGGPLSTLSKIFDAINAQACPNLLSESIKSDIEGFEENEVIESQPSEEQPITRNISGFLVIPQVHLYKEVFYPVEDEKEVNFKFFIAVLTEYIRTLNYYQIPVEYFIYKLLISVLVHNNRFYQLHQFLQYHIIGDSVPIACQLLSLEKVYPPVYQLALDMLKRLSNKNKRVEDQIIEVLLSSHEYIAGIRFIRRHSDARYSVQRFLSGSLENSDAIQFYTVYNFFLKRNEITNEEASFSLAFHEMFPDGL
eukprot:CAMPEP_0174270954 /NCGR_PEP_ID=MMETSP0439-20130205/46345_1 /TAXON_ID=0 /ORGANISM="Stereomyxa ramosa, Strain Chinc5" /LENGTH=374 /DNA_ID=CAMNT_0015360651 /DNA_START=828 /DNA_END=1952 /DNA_ORIENTATION=+